MSRGLLRDLGLSGSVVKRGHFKTAHYPADISVDRGGARLCFHAFYESRFLHQIRQEASPGLPGGASQG